MCISFSFSLNERAWCFPINFFWSNQSSMWLKPMFPLRKLLLLVTNHGCEIYLSLTDVNLSSFFFLFLFPFCGYRHIHIFVIFVTTLEEKSTSCNFHISLLDVRFPLFFGHRLYNYFLEICSFSCGLCHGTLEMIFIWVFYTHGTGIISYISFQWLPLLSIWNDLLNKMECSYKWVVIHKLEFHMHPQHFHVCLLAILFCFLNFSCILQECWQF